LVCFDTESDNEQEQGGVADTVTTTCTTNKTVVSDDSIETRLPPYKKTRQNKRRRNFWRSKRDFWRLGRATASLSSSSQTIDLPKAAWKKMSNEAPWQRPDYIDYAPDIHNEEEEVHVHAHQNDGWKRHMYKSLRQVDQYLQQVQSICTNQDSCSCNNNNNNSIRHDCNSMNSSDQQQCKTCTVRAAWKEFCRPCHTEDLKDKTTATADCNSQAAAITGTPAATASAATTTISTAMTGNALGQYFCHPANARQLVNVCLERIQQQVLQITMARRPPLAVTRSPDFSLSNPVAVMVKFWKRYWTNLAGDNNNNNNSKNHCNQHQQHQHACCN
jgi:hypothetical protein